MQIACLGLVILPVVLLTRLLLAKAARRTVKTSKVIQSQGLHEKGIRPSRIYLLLEGGPSEMGTSLHMSHTSVSDY